MTASSDPSAAPARRFNPWLLLAIPLCALAASASWWLQKSYPTDQAIYLQQLVKGSPFDRYRTVGNSRDEILTPDVMLVLDRLSEECADIDDEVERTEAKLRAADPHLDQAIKDPIETPFVGPHSKSFSESLSKCRPLTEAIVDDFVENSDARFRGLGGLESALRSVLYCVVSRTKVPSADLASLQTFFRGGANDPLISACLVRSLDQSSDDFTPAAMALFEQRKARPLSLHAKAFVYCSFPHAKDTLNAAEPLHFAEVTAEAPEVFGDLWQSVSSEKPDLPVEIFFFVETYNTLITFNGNGVVDLLLELDKRTTPSVPASIKHFVAARILRSIAGAYRGTAFISDTSPTDLEKFDSFAARSTKHLLKTWTMAPYHSVLAAMLMDLEMRAGTTPRSFDQWFRHSLACASDSKLAFANYHTALETKWGGSAERQLWFAEKCALHEPLDAGLFFRTGAALYTRIWEHAFTEKMGSDLRMVRLAKTYVRQLKTFSRSEKIPDVGSGELVPVIAILWQAGQFEDLDWLLTLYFDAVNCESLHAFRLHRDEVKDFSRQAAGNLSSCWREIHAYTQGDTARLTVADLDRLDLALAEAREQVLDSPELARLVAGYHRRSQILRGLLAGEEILFSEQDLRGWYLNYRSTDFRFGTTQLVAEVKETPGDGNPADTSNDPMDPSASASVDAANDLVVDSPASEVGYCEISTWANVSDARLMLPVRVDPPFRLSADMEVLLDPDGTAFDPYGVSLLAGPACGPAMFSDLRGPIFTVSHGFNAILRDYLPAVTWVQGSETYRASSLNRPFRKANLRMEVFADGYRNYFDNKLWEQVDVGLNTAGVIQIGRYTNAGFSGIAKTKIEYRLSNVRLQKLSNQSVRDSKSATGTIALH
ncbi:MAG: hypothetical protein ACO1RT_06415 [Planctomycetaceae bacterium]